MPGRDQNGDRRHRFACADSERKLNLRPESADKWGMSGIHRHILGRAGLLLLSVALQLASQRVAMSAPSLLFASTLGGNQSETIRAIATDAAQNIYVVGETYSTDFPGAVTSSSARHAGDAFVVKLNSSGTQILYSVVLSGDGYDSARGVAVDPSGNAYVTGVTTSTDFPITAGAFQRSSMSPGLEDAFVVKLNPAGAVLYATYLGGSASDLGYAIAIDPSGAAYVAGSTNSVNFPVTGSAPQRTFRGGSDCFVAKLDPSGATLSYSTYLGGESIDVCKGIAVDASGAAFVTGTTTSTSFPVTGALQPTLSGWSDAFLTKISPAGDRFLFSTYLGGEGADDGNVVRVDSAGVVYVGGDTSSIGFPVTSGGMQKLYHGGYDGFVCGVANDGSRIVFATYLGGSGADVINDLFVGQDGRIVAAGYTSSIDFPVVQSFQSSFGGSFDAFVAVLGAGGTTLDFASYVGGGGDDRAYGVAPLGSGQLVVAGQVLAGTVPYMQRSFSSAVSGNQDGFIAAVSYAQPLRFIPVTPCRVADTRNPAGPFGGPAVAGGSSRDFVIPAGACGIPYTAQAYSLNVTVVPAGPLLFLAIWPGGQSRPLVSLLNSLDGRIKSNAAIVPAGADGAVSIFATDKTHTILDINGYFVPATDLTAQAFYPLTPCRIADTRTATGPLGGPSLIGASIRTFPVLLAAACGIPVGAQAYSLNFTLVPGGPVGFLSTWPTGLPKPFVSTTNVPTGTVVAAAAIVPAGTGGSIDVFVTDTTDLALDINGYFAPAGEGGLSLYSVTPCRVLDSRSSGTPITGLAEVNITANACAIPSSVKAFVLNATVIPTGSLNYLALWQQGRAQPRVSTLNAWDGSWTSNMAIVPTTNGSISLYAANSTHVILDLSGYFAQ